MSGRDCGAYGLDRGRLWARAQLWIAAAVLSAAPGAAEARDATPLREALHAVDLRGHVEEWPELTLVVRDRARLELDPEAFAALEREVHGAFAPSALAAQVESGLQESLSAGRVAVVLNHFEGPGAALRAAERAALLPADLNEQPVFLAGVPVRPPSKTRRDWLRRLDAATQRTDNVMAVALGVSLAMARGLHALRCGTGESRAALEAQASRSVLRHRNDVAMRLRAAGLFAYRDLSLGAIAEHTRFLESEDGRAFLGALHAELERALESADGEARAALAPQIASGCSR